MRNNEIEVTLFEIATRLFSQGPGFAQERVVLEQAKRKLRPQSTYDEQKILDAWNGLFAKGRLIWGYNLSNPGPPFFHVPIESEELVS